MIVLGSTGSIGVNTLNLAKKYNLEVEVLVCGNNIELLNKQIKEFNPKQVVIKDKNKLNQVAHPKKSAGNEAIIEAIHNSKSNLVVNALVGFSGLIPTIEAIIAGKTVALANKESLVVGGKFIDISKIKPIDSEHFALWYLIDKTKKIDSFIITASGGSFRDYPIEKLKNVTVEEALNHPNWKMGKKITIDSATMVNKMFELIEAKYLFNTTKIDAIIETKSIIHGLINFTDGSTTAHLANANMKLPIAYAILDKVEEQILKPIDLIEIAKLEFRKIDEVRYPIWQLKETLLKNDNLGVIFNSANDYAVELFLKNKISFLDISKLIFNAIEKFSDIKINSIEELIYYNDEVKKYLNGFKKIT